MITIDLSASERTEPATRQRTWNGIAALATRFHFRQQSSRAMRRWGYGAFILVSLLYASFYPVASPVLDRMDTALFVAIQMLWLLPPALFLLIWSRRQINQATVLRGFFLGSCMGAALFLLTLAMAYTSITETAMFSCANGVIVVLVSWLLFRQHVHLLTWLACLCSVTGIAILFFASRMHWQGDLLAFLGGLLLTGYTFLIERFYFRSMPSQNLSLRAACGIEWLTMAGEALLAALLFGDWHSAHFAMPSDLMTFAYIGVATTLFPMIITVMMRRHINGITLTFITIIEPIVGACFAYVFAHERFLPSIYLGGVLAVGSLALQALTDLLPSHVPLFPGSHQRDQFLPPLKTSTSITSDAKGCLSIRTCLPLGRRARALLAHLWSAPDGLDFSTLSSSTGIPVGQVHRLLVYLQHQGYILSCQHVHRPNRYMLHPCWRLLIHVESHS